MAMTPMMQASAEAKVLASMLAECQVGDVVTYDALTAAIGRDVTGPQRHVLETARRLVMRERRMVFDCVQKVGLKRLSDTEIVALSDRTRDHLRRATRRTVKKLTCVDYDAMPREQQTKHNAAISMLGVIAELSTEKSLERLSVQIEKTGTDLPIAKASIAALGLVL